MAHSSYNIVQELHLKRVQVSDQDRRLGAAAGSDDAAVTSAQDSSILVP